MFCELGIQKDRERVRSSLSPSRKGGVDWSLVIFSLQLTSLDQKWKLGDFSAVFLESNIPANLCLFLFDLLCTFKYLVVLIVLTLHLLFHSPLRANPLLESFHITLLSSLVFVSGSIGDKRHCLLSYLLCPDTVFLICRICFWVFVRTFINLFLPYP